MKGMISATTLRSSGDSHISFDVDENNYNEGGDRVVSKVETLDGEVVTTDWGFSIGRSQITMRITLSIDNYETLVDFKEDNVVSFVFLYKWWAYSVIIKTVTKAGFEGDKIMVNVVMEIVNRYYGNGEYTA
jgi:hypothetical protein